MFRILPKLTPRAGLVLLIFALLLVVPSTIGFMVLPKEVPVIEDRWGHQEKLAIQSASFNSTDNSLQLFAIKIAPTNQSINFSVGIIKDSQGNTIQTSSNLTPTELLNNQATKIIVKFNGTLNSGTYSVSLATDRGGVFVSPSFAIP